MNLEAKVAIFFIMFKIMVFGKKNFMFISIFTLKVKVLIKVKKNSASIPKIKLLYFSL